jgi:hypothetical protein
MVTVRTCPLMFDHQADLALNEASATRCTFHVQTFIHVSLAARLNDVFLLQIERMICCVPKIDVVAMHRLIGDGPS